jgi:hypothetical protein
VPEASPAEDGHRAPEGRRRVGGEDIPAIRDREEEAEEESPADVGQHNRSGPPLLDGQALT